MFKKGDKVICRDAGMSNKGLVEGEIYTVKGDGPIYFKNKSIVLEELEGWFFTERFELVEEKPSLEEQIAEAQKLIGKKITRGGSWLVLTARKIEVILTQDEAIQSSGYVFDAFKGDPLIAIRDGLMVWPFDDKIKVIDDGPRVTKVELSDTYNAFIYHDEGKVKIGGVTFDSSLLDKLVAARDNA